MVIRIKFKNEEQLELICGNCKDIGDAFMLENVFIERRLYDTIIIEKEKIEWVK